MFFGASKGTINMFVYETFLGGTCFLGRIYKNRITDQRADAFKNFKCSSSRNGRNRL